MADAAPRKSLVDDSITIHIHDESRGMTKDFECSRSLLLRHMKYFKSFIPDPSCSPSAGGASQGEAEEIDISVHCDVYIFEFLVRYMNSPDTPPPLESNTVVSILISSEFLQMEDLVLACLRYMARNLGDILCLPVDLSCISDVLCAKLAKFCPAESLVGILDKSGKLLPRLYKKRLEIDFRERPPRSGDSSSSSSSNNNNNNNDDDSPTAKLPNPTSNSSCLICCRYCYRLFPESELAMNGGFVRCQRATSSPDVGFRGEVNGPECEPVDNWSLTNFVASLRRQRMEWVEIYWMLWAAVHMLRLTDGSLVSADLESSGFYHPKPATFAELDGQTDIGLWGVYSCCGETALKFDPWSGKAHVGGCVAKPVELAPVRHTRSQGKIKRNKSKNPAQSYFNEEARVQLATRARKCFGSGYGSKFQVETKVALAELQQAAGAPPAATAAKTSSSAEVAPSASSGSHWSSVRTAVASRSSISSSGGSRKGGGGPGQRGNRNEGNDTTALDSVCTTSMKEEKEIANFRSFVSAPIIYRADAVKNRSDLLKAKELNSDARGGNPSAVAGGGTNSLYKFVGAEGFVKFATTCGVYVNTERYLAALNHAPNLGEEASTASSNTGRELVKGTINDPLKGLDPQQRSTLSRATSSKVALTMDSIKRTAWYRDAQRESDVERVRRISCDLFSLRNRRDIAEKSASDQAPINTNEYGSGGGVNAQSQMRGGTWRNSFEIKWSMI